LTGKGVSSMDRDSAPQDKTCRTRPGADRGGRRPRFDHFPGMVFTTDGKGLLRHLNEGGVRLLGGAARKDWIGKRTLESLFARPDEADAIRELVFRDGAVQDVETSFRRLDETVVPVSLSFSSSGCQGGGLAGEGVVLDIGERKQREKFLQETAEVYHTVVENSLAAISIHQDGRNVFVNRRYAEMLGFDSPAQCTGRPFWASVHPDDLSMVRDRGLLRERQQILPAQYVFRQMKKDGKTEVWVQIRATHAMYMGKPAAVTNFIDITQSKMAEEEIRSLSKRLVKVREDERKKLAADLHDQMGQTLTAMHFEIEALQKDLPPSLAAQKELCERLIGNVEWLANEVRKTTSYLRKDILEQKMLIAVLERHIQDFSQRHPEIHVKFLPLGFKKRLNPEIELVLYRVFQEGLTNVVKHAQATEMEIMLTYSHPRVMLTMRDNGVGFSQGRDGLGNKAGTRGIGLVSMKERVTSFGGQIDILSAPGKGTTIRVDIPV